MLKLLLTGRFLEIDKFPFTGVHKNNISGTYLQISNKL